MESGHTNVSYEDFKTIAKNFNNNHWESKNTESLLIKEKPPTLKTQEKLLPLKLFN